MYGLVKSRSPIARAVRNVVGIGAARSPGNIRVETGGKFSRLIDALDGQGLSSIDLCILI
jgi:hypothetical protein